MSATFWDRLLDELERSSAEQLPWLVRQGRWWSEFASKGYGVEPRSFDLREWAEHLRQVHGFEVQLADALPTSRRGQPEAMELLVRALCWQAGSPRLRLEGDEALVTVSADGVTARSGPLVEELSRLLGTMAGESGPLFRCPCPVEDTSCSAPVDLAALARTTMGEADFERELIESFLAEGRQQFASLAVHYAARTLHTLKGSAAMVGASRLAELLEEQEHAPDCNRLPILEAEFARVVAWLQLRHDATRL